MHVVCPCNVVNGSRIILERKEGSCEEFRVHTVTWTFSFLLKSTES